MNLWGKLQLRGTEETGYCLLLLTSASSSIPKQGPVCVRLRAEHFASWSREAHNNPNMKGTPRSGLQMRRLSLGEVRFRA